MRRRTRLGWLVAVALTSGCGAGAGDGKGSASEGEGEGEGDGGTDCFGTAFADDATTWGLPDYGVDANGDPLFTEVAAERTCPGGGRINHQTLDLTGDGRLDLIVSQDCGDAQTGRTTWRVHPSDGDAFAAAAVLWALPDYGATASGEAPFARTAQESGCPGGGSLRHQLINLTGDGLTDLVITDNCTVDPEVGSSHWRVHENTGSGFAREPTRWSLPLYEIRDGAPFERSTTEEACVGGGVLRALLADLDGDERPELVVTENCGTDDTGRHHWLVHDNTGSGFADVPTEWSLPDYGTNPDGSSPLSHVAGDSACPGGGTVRHQLVDLAGNGRPDLVVTENCGETLDAWRVHANSGSGFSQEPATWTLPDYGVGSDGRWMFDRIADERSCPGGGTVRYQVLDLYGERSADLVVSRNCTGDAQTGATAWRTHANTGSGFATETTDWTLPDYGVNRDGGPLFERIADSQACPAAGSLTFQLIELSGAGKPDFVVSNNCASDSATGASSWRVHRMQCQ